MNPRFESFLYAYQNASQPIKELVDSEGIGTFVRDLMKDLPQDVPFQHLLIVTTNHLLGVTTQDQVNTDLEAIGVLDTDTRKQVVEAIGLFATECKRIAAEEMATHTTHTDNAKDSSAPAAHSEQAQKPSDVSPNPASPVPSPQKPQATPPVASPKPADQQASQPATEQTKPNNSAPSREGALPTVRTMRSDASAQQAKSTPSEKLDQAVKAAPGTEKQPPQTTAPVANSKSTNQPVSQSTTEQTKPATNPIPPPPSTMTSSNNRWESEKPDIK